MTAASTQFRLPDGRVIAVGADYYLASCNRCGWVGSSGECGTDEADEVFCPVCHMAGADCGSVAETAVRVEEETA